MSQPEMKHAFFVYSVLICELDDALHQGYFFEGDSLWFGVNPASSVLYSACPAASNKTQGDRNNRNSGLELRARAQRHRARVRTSLIPNRNHVDADRDVKLSNSKAVKSGPDSPSAARFHMRMAWHPAWPKSTL